MTSAPSLNLLLSNDDGVYAQGIRTLANTLVAAGHRVTIVCPDQERSATSNALTIHRPIRIEIIEGIFDPRITAWACSGTPADCMKFALSALLGERPDFVLSGINHGGNLGTDALYSGTVAAATEGLLEGIDSIAFSLVDAQTHNFQPTADFAVKLLRQLQRQELAQLNASNDLAMLLNVNVPNLPHGKIAGVKVTRQGLRRYIEQFQKREDPRGNHYYWLAGEVIEELPQPNAPEALQMLPSDVEAIAAGYITMTPLQYLMNDLTRIQALSQLTWEA